MALEFLSRDVFAEATLSKSKSRESNPASDDDSNSCCNQNTKINTDGGDRGQHCSSGVHEIFFRLVKNSGDYKACISHGLDYSSMFSLSQKSIIARLHITILPLTNIR